MKAVNVILLILIFIVGFYKFNQKERIIYKTNIISQKTILFEIEKAVTFIDKKDLKIVMIKFKRSNIELLIAGKHQLVFNFLKLFEKIFSIKSIELNYNKLLFANIKFLKNSYNKINYKNIKFDKIPNLFLPHKNKKPINTKAIIGDFVYIDRWYKIGDIYKGYKIYKIYPTYIELKKGDIFKKIYIFKDLNGSKL